MHGVRGALPLQDVVFLDLQPGSNDLLFRVNNVEGACGLYVHYRTLQPVTRDVAGEDRQRGAVGTAQVGRQRWRHNWARSSGGELARRRPSWQSPNGAESCLASDGIGCAKCHAIDGRSAAVGGPSLAGAAARFTVPYLVESVLAPSRTVSPVFRATLFVLRDGKASQGWS